MLKKTLLAASMAVALIALPAIGAFAATSIVGNPDGPGTLTITGKYNYYFGNNSQTKKNQPSSTLSHSSGAQGRDDVSKWLRSLFGLKS